MSILPFVSSLLVLAAVWLGLDPLADMWDRFSRWWIGDLLPQMEALNIDRARLAESLRWWGLVVFGLPLVAFFVLGMKMLAVPVFIFLATAPRWWLNRRISRRRSQIRGQLAPAMTALANTARAGLPLAVGLASVVEELPDPIRSEFRWIVLNTRAGVPLSKALESTRQRLQIESFTLFSAAIQTTLSRGGRIMELLDRLAETVREVERLERNMENATASGRRVITVLAIFPVIFLSAFLVLYPRGTLLMFQTPIGQGLLIATIGLVWASVHWAKKILAFSQ